MRAVILFILGALFLASVRTAPMNTVPNYLPDIGPEIPDVDLSDLPKTLQTKVIEAYRAFRRERIQTLLRKHGRHPIPEQSLDLHRKYLRRQLDFEVQKAREFNRKAVERAQYSLDTAEAWQKAARATYEELEQEATRVSGKEVALKKLIGQAKTINRMIDVQMAESETAAAKARLQKAQGILDSAAEAVNNYAARLRELLSEVKVDQSSEDVKDSSPNNRNEFSTETVLRAPLGNIGMTKQADFESWAKQAVNSARNGGNSIRDTAGKIALPGGSGTIGFPSNFLPVRVPLRK